MHTNGNITSSAPGNVNWHRSLLEAHSHSRAFNDIALPLEVQMYSTERHSERDKQGGEESDSQQPISFRLIRSWCEGQCGNHSGMDGEH